MGYKKEVVQISRNFLSFHKRRINKMQKILAFYRLLLIWSRTHSVPGHLVPHYWSPRTNSHGPFGPHEQMVPKTIGPKEQTVPANLVPMDNWPPWTIGPQNHYFLFLFKNIFFSFIFNYKWYM